MHISQNLKFQLDGSGLLSTVPQRFVQWLVSSPSKYADWPFPLNLPRWTLDNGHLQSNVLETWPFSQGFYCPIPETHGPIQGVIRPGSVELGACSLAGTKMFTKVTMSIVHTHNIGNFGDLVHIHNLPIIQAGQAAAFGQLFSEAVRAGQSAVQTQHLGLYFQLGAEYAISRCTLTSIE